MKEDTEIVLNSIWVALIIEYLIWLYLAIFGVV